MKTAMPRSELDAWLCWADNQVKENRRVSSLCANLYLAEVGMQLLAEPVCHQAAPPLRHRHSVSSRNADDNVW